ncbi:MAG: PKD-like domain-containing protein [Flavobacteriales bacterium]
MFLLFTKLTLAQSINVVSFNSSETLTPGAGVSVHMNPTGVFTIENSFYLELSEVGGDFTNAVVLATVTDFYTSLINGVLPEDILSGQYKLRIRSTTTNSESDEISQTTDFFSVNNSITSLVPSVASTMPSNTNSFNCLADNNINPSIGMPKEAYNSTTALGSTKYITVTPSLSTNSIVLKRINISSGAVTTMTPISGLIYEIPDDLPIGTYNFEIQETDSLENASFYSFAFIFHSGLTNFGNASSDLVCTGESVIFSVNIANTGLLTNSMASYYSFDWGDGTAPELYTHADIMNRYTNDNPVSHVFNEPSCLALNQEFYIVMNLYNKGMSQSTGEATCDAYSINGSGSAGQVTTSESPQASFDLLEEICITDFPIVATNTSEAGTVPNADGDCDADPIFYWSYKKPSSSSFIPIFSGNSWLTNNGQDLLIPAEDVDEPGCWGIQLSAANPEACTLESVAVNYINVEILPVATFDLLQDAVEVDEICVNTPVSLTNTSNISTTDFPCVDTLTSNEAPTFQWSISPNVGWTSSGLSTETPVVIFTSAGEYTFTLLITTECGTSTVTDELSVIGDPTVEFPSESQTLCSTESTRLINFNTELTPVYSTGLYAPSSYNWVISGVGITADDYTFVNSTASDPLPTIQLNSYGEYNISISADSNCEIPASDSLTITLKQTPEITNTLVAQVICNENSSSEFIVVANAEDVSFSWTATENINISGYALEGSEATIPAQFITNNTSAAQDLVYTITPTLNGCVGPPFEYIITVNPVPIIANKEVTICNGDTFIIEPLDENPIEIVPAGTTYSWPFPALDNLPPGSSTTGASAQSNQPNISQTLINSFNSPITVTYTVTPEINGCTGDTFEVLITVNPTGNVQSIASQTLCNGDSTLGINFNSSNTSSPGSTIYSWTNNNPAIGLASNGTGDILSFTANNATTEQIEGVITVTPTYVNNGVSCIGESDTFRIKVDPSPLVSFSQENQTILTGETTTAITLSSPTTGVTISWSATVPDSVDGLTTLVGTDTIPSETLINTSTLPQVVVYSAIATGDIGFDCAGLETLYTVTVNPVAQVNPADDQLVCNEDAIFVEFSSIVTGGATTYAWTNDNSEIGLSNSGTGNIDITSTNTTTSPITSNITVTPSFENEGNINIGESISFTITVNPSGQVDGVLNQIVSNTFDTTAITFTTENSNGTTSYNWTNDLSSIGLASTGSGNIPVFSGVNAGTFPVSASISVTPTFTSNGVSCVGPETPFEITINPTAQVNPTEDMVVSNGDSLVIPFETINTGGTSTYTWTNTDPTTGLENSGSSDIGFTAVNTGTSPIVTTVVVTPGFENGGNSNSGSANTFVITVNPTAQVDPINNVVVCNEEVLDPTVFTTQNTGGVTTYSWTNDNTSIGLSSSGAGSIAGFTAINTSLISQLATITVTPTFENAGVSNTGLSETFTITVNPSAQVEPIPNQVLCNQEFTEEIIFTTENIDGTTSYSWTNDNVAIGIAAAGDGNISSFVSANVAASSISSTITVTPTYTNNGISCTGLSETFTITVNPSAQVNEILNQELCEGQITSPITFSTTNVDGITTYSWTNDNTNIGLADSGEGDISSFTVLNTSGESETATITVVPTYSSSGIDCIGSEYTFILAVNPGAQVNSIENQLLCNGDLSMPVQFNTTNSDGVSEYTWTNSNTSIGLSSTGTGDIGAFEVINTSTSAQQALITVTPIYTNNGVVCSGNPEQFTITVNPLAQVNDVTSQNTVLCDGEFTPVYIFTTANTDGITTFTWTNDNVAIGLANSGTGGIPSFTVLNSTQSAIFATISVIPSYENNGIVCEANPETFTILVNPSPTMDPLEDIVLCNNEIASLIEFTTSNSDGNTTYTWINDNTSIGLSSSGNGDIPSFTANNLSSVTGTALISVTPTYENNGVVCIGAAQTFTISALSEIELSGTITDALDCDNSNSGSVDLTVSGGSGAYEFLWSNDSDNEDLTNVTSGDYTVNVTDSEGCVALSETFTIFRQEDLTVNLNAEIVPFCENNLVTQENRITIFGGLGPYTVNWSGGSVSINDNTFMTAYENGTYNVLVTDQYGCQVNTEIIIDFEELGEASFDYYSSGDVDCGISVFNELEFVNTSSGDYISILWDFGDGSSVAIGEAVTYQYLNSGAYVVTQTVEYSYGCSEVYSYEINVTDGYDIVLPNAFSPNNDGVNDTIRPVYACVNNIEMSIYDTFGSKLYYENNLQLQGWDGTLVDGENAENGNYLIVVKGTTIHNEEITLRGVFVLLR